MLRHAIPILFCLIVVNQLPAQNSSFLPVQKDNKWGFINNDGQLIIPLQYDNVRPQPGSQYSIVRNADKEAFFNQQNGEFASQFHSACYLLSGSYFLVNDEGLFGVEKDKEIIVPTLYHHIRIDQVFNAFIARNEIGTTIYQMDGKDKVFFPADSIQYYYSMVIAIKNNKIGLFDKNGKELLPFDYDFLEIQNRILFLRSYEKVTSCVHPCGKVITGSTDRKIQFLKSNGNKPMPFYFFEGENKLHSVYSDTLSDFSATDYDISWTLCDGYVKLYNKASSSYGLADSTGHIILDVNNKEVRHLFSDFFRVGSTNNKRLFSIKKGFIGDGTYWQIQILYNKFSQKNYFTFQRNNQLQIWDENSTPVTVEWFDSITINDTAIFLVEKNNLLNFLDTSGKLLSKNWLEGYSDVKNTGFIVTKNGVSGLLSRDGTELLPIIYDNIEVKNNLIKAYNGENIEIYNFENNNLTHTATTRNIPVLRIGSNYRFPNATAIPNYEWQFDSTQNLYGIRNTSANTWTVAPSYDFIFPGQDLGLTLIMNRCDSNYIKIGPLTFYANMQFGLANIAIGKVLFEPVFAMIFYYDLLKRKDIYDQPSYGFGREGDFARAIDMQGNWYILSYTGDSSKTRKDFIEPIHDGRAKAWTYDSLTIGKRNEGCNIMSVSQLYSSFHKFVRPLDSYTDSIVKKGGLYYLLAINPDSTQVFRFAGGKSNAMGKTPIDKFEPAFMRYDKYSSYLEMDRKLGYKNTAIYFEERRYSYIDTMGHLVYNLNFTKAGNFSEGLAFVKENGKYGFIDRDGNIIIPFKFKRADDFSEGLAPAKIKGLYGYIDHSGDWAIEPKYYSAGAFSEGLAPVRIKSEWGYISDDGKFEIEGKFKRCFPFENGLALVFLKRGYGLINKTGKYVIKPKQDKILPPDENNIRLVAKHNKKSYVDSTGKYICGPYKNIYAAGEGIYVRKKRKKHILFNIEGEKIGKFISQSNLIASDSIIITRTALQYQYFTLNGDSLLKPFKMASPFRNGLAVVSDNTQTYIIDKKGQVQRTFSLGRRLKNAYFDENMLIHMSQSSRYLLIDTNGRTIFSGKNKPVYSGNGIYILSSGNKRYLYNHNLGIHYTHSKWDEISEYSEDMFIVKNMRLYGFTDTRGKYYLKPAYTSISVDQRGLYRVTYGDRWGYVRSDGTVLWEVKE